MRKNVLVSILAMTSASTLTAWADANVNQIRTDAATDWQGASDLKIESGVIVSPSGATITQNIGKLYPGTYTLKATTSTNAKIKVNGAELNAQQSFSLTEAKDVTISIESVDGNRYEVGGLALTLVYDFETQAKAPLTTKLSEVSLKIFTGDTAGQELQLEVSKLAEKINKLANDAEDAYAKYVEYGLYAQTLKESSIYGEILALEEKVEAQASNSSAYANAKAKGEAQNALLAEKKAIVDGLTDATEKTYVTNITKSAYDAANAKVTEFQDGVEKAYTDGSAGIDYPEAKVNEFVTASQKLIDAYAQAIADARADHAAYVEVSGQIATLKNLYNTSLQEVYNSLQGDETHPDVYGNLRTQAQTELNAVYVKIMAVEAVNGTADNHTQAADKKTENVNSLTGYTTEISDLKTKYVNRAQALKTAYTNATTQLSTLQTKLDDLKKTPGVGDNATYTETINKIQASIDAFKRTITTDNEANTIDSKDYSTTVNNIQKSIDDLTKNSQGAVNNYQAWKALDTSLTDKQQKLDAAKEAVAKMKSADGTYTASGKYTNDEAAIQKSIDDYEAAAQKALEAGTCVAYKTNNETAINNLSTTISNYQQAAQAAVDAYNTIATALPKYEAAIKKLDDKVTNPSVTVGETTTTYGDKLAAFNKTVSDIKAKRDEALKLTDLKHSQTMVAAAAMTDGVTIESEVETLVASYDVDKTNYDATVVDKALAQLLAQAKSLVDGAQGTLDAYGWTGLGLSGADIMEKKQAIETKLDVQRDKIAEAEAASDKTAAMTQLTAVNTAVAAINTEIGDLTKEADAAKAKVAENDAAKTNADKVVAGINEQLNGKDDGTLKGVIALNEDGSRTPEFQTLVGGLQAKITEQQKAIQNAYTAETLKAAWADSEDAKGIESKLNDIKAEVEAARVQADSSTINYKAYTAIQSKITELGIAANLSQASAAVAAVTNISAEAKAYYDGVISGYTTNLATLENKVEEAYGEGKRNCAWVKDGIIGQLTNLNNLIKAVGPNAKDNQTAYEGQTTAYNETNDYWSKTYYTISTGDQTSIVQTYLTQLTEQQGNLTELNAQIAKDYKEGKSKANNQSITDQLAEITQAIKDIADAQSEGYNEAVAKDNEVRYNNFTAAVKAVRDQYTAALTTIGKYSGLTNSALVATANTAVTKADSTINGILTKLRAEESKVKEEYIQTVSPALFDATESHKAYVEEFAAQIETAIAKLDETVSGKAQTVFRDKFAEANSKLAAAIAELTTAGYQEDVVTAAFADVRKIVGDANKDFGSEYFALSVDAHLNAFETIDGLLVTGKEEAAKAEWKAVITKIDGQVAKESADLQTFEYTGDLDGTEKQRILDNYNNLVKTSVDAAKEAYNNIAEGQHFAELSSVKALLVPFTSSTIYIDAQAASQNQVANQAAYDKMDKALAELQTKLDAAVAFVNGYVITDDCGRSTAQNLVNSLQETIDDNLLSGGCVNYYNNGNGAFKTASEGIANAIGSIYDNANEYESQKLGTEIESLKGDQNKAAAAVDADADKAAEVAAYIPKIDELVVALSDTLNSRYYLALTATAKQPVLLQFEKQIANMRAELAGYYNAGLVASTVTALNEALGKVEEDYNAEVEVLNGCHKNVQNVYTEALAAVKTSIDGISADIAKYNDADGSILFYEGKINTNINSVATVLTDLKADIAAAQVPYTINDNKYKELTQELDELDTTVNTVVVKLNGYKYFDHEAQSYTDEVQDIRDLITADRTAAQTAHNATDEEDLLTENSTNANKATVLSRIESLDKEATYTEMNGRINTPSDTLSLLGAYNKVFGRVNPGSRSGILLTPEVQDELNDKLNEIYSSYRSLQTYNNDAYVYGWISADIDGNPLKDENGDPTVQMIDYLDDAVPAAETRRTALLSELDALNAQAISSAYMLGDVNRDKHVLVDDYTQILNYVLEKETVAEGSMEFLAADANEDGKVNIGDVTRTTDIILNSTSGFSMRRAAALAVAAQQTEAGHIELATEQEGDITRVTVKLVGQPAAGCQMDIKLPSSVTLLSESAVSSEHALSANTLADGTHRVVLSSLQNSELCANGEAVLVLELTGRGTENIGIDNVLAADAAGMVYSVAGTGNITGINGVNTDQNFKQKIYSVGGQMLKSLQKGVNILRGADGSSKKVFGK